MEIGPKDFFDDKFDKPQPTDTALQSAAREAGWVLSELVDGIAFEKRQHVVNIINKLSAALNVNDGLEESEINWIPTSLRGCLLYTSPSPRDQRGSRMPSSA